MTTPTPDPTRLTRRRREHERQAVVFGLIIAFLLIAALGAVAAYSGAISTPFSRPIYTPVAVAPSPEPCLPAVKGQPDGALPVPYEKIKVRVFNASETGGIASATAEVLDERGFTVIATGDMSRQVETSELHFGVKGITRAYTLAAQFTSIRLVLDDRDGGSVDMLVGNRYTPPMNADQVLITADTPLQDVQGCVPADQITPIVREEPAASVKYA
ncbi:LytR C-terminal domain-containing protein [Isoptericola sp. NEAU-Y5]|uniref:LytR C-terminal domain-containing protein n=1 Tax=Isoptericola luteus TaxID=2879484 RepID=A0ABS7ZJ33_9MICO|nr:LytR C-terminal domain-containing protein [Isoptericola sp. NEAU-Y5]MCA5894336.1 LytR C-terminal domain-containing protein [Isoptericola sp. NEAU-Y5]